MGNRAATRTETVYARLRQDVLTGELLPGARLPFAELSARYGSSTSAIREGLQRLVAHGLVVSEPQLGFRVVTLSEDDLIDLTTARCEIEGTALAMAVRHGDLAWESAVVAAGHLLERTPATDARGSSVLSRGWVDAHQSFHATLIDGCPNRRIKVAAASLRDAAELYRHWSFRAAPSDRDVRAEHAGLVAAVLARDADLAVARLHEHLDTTARLLLSGAREPEATAVMAGTAET